MGALFRDGAAPGLGMGQQLRNSLGWPGQPWCAWRQPRASSLLVCIQHSSGRARERDQPASFPSDFIFLEFPLMVPFFFFLLFHLFFFLGQLEKIMFWLPWKHASKLLVDPRHAWSSRMASQGGGGLPSLPESGRSCSPVALDTRGPDLPSVPTPVYSANTTLLTNSCDMPWDL